MAAPPMTRKTVMATINSISVKPEDFRDLADRKDPAICECVNIMGAPCSSGK